jgi:pilus assembly protein CpaB
MEQDQEKGKPMQVTVVTLLVNPEQSERLALASTEGKIQLALRNPLDQGAPETSGIKPAGLLGSAKGQTAERMAARPAVSKGKPGPVTMTPPAAPPPPSVEVIRGDKRATEVIR